MGRKRELSYEERITVKILRESGYSFPQIAKAVGCQYSTCMRIFNSFKKTGSIHQKQRTGRPKKLTKEVRDSCAELQGCNDSAN